MTRLLLFFAFLPFFTSAQVYERFTPTMSRTCTFDSTKSVFLPQGWEVYQTIDDKWDGDRLVECFSFLPDTRRLPLEQFDLNSKIFIAKVYDSPVSLTPDALHDVQFSLSQSTGVTAQIDTCGEYLCSGLRLLVDIPDETGTDFTSREYTFSQFATDEFWTSACFITEYFIEQYVNSAIIELDIQEAPPESYIEFRSLGIAHLDDYFLDKLYTIDIPETTYDGVGSYNLELSDLTGNYVQNVAFMFDSMVYPANNYIHFIDANPIENKPTIQDINITLGYEHVSFQPQVELRGGLVEGGTDRHNLHVINEGSEICITFIEISFDETGSYTHRAGGLDFRHNLGCFKFEDQSTFEIAENAVLTYGESGSGVLYLKDESKIILKTNASLTINNQLLLGKNKNDEALTIELHPGSHLSFGHEAYIRDKQGCPYRYIKIINKGGSIDIDNLSNSNQMRFNLIDETQQNTTSASFIQIWQSKFDNNIRAKIKSENNQIATFIVYQLSGRIAFKNTHQLYLGFNEVNINLANYPAGIYLCSIQLDNGIHEQKKVIVH